MGLGRKEGDPPWGSKAAQRPDEPLEGPLEAEGSTEILRDVSQPEGKQPAFTASLEPAACTVQVHRKSHLVA